MAQKISSELEWHDGKEIPDPSSGSFLILTASGNLAEAEYIDRMRAANPRGFSPWVRRAIKP